MGLCKCEKRKVTSLFCFEHQVNVCEHCLLAEHNRCIVKTYVQWLQDADYTPVCVLCNNSLADQSSGECVRLLCYDVVHWNCLDEYGANFPTNTAPAGFSCPVPGCKFGLFPAPNAGSPLAEALRKRLATTSWARRALGIDSAVERPDSTLSSAENSFVSSQNTHSSHDESAMRERPNLMVQIDEVASEAGDQRVLDTMVSEARANMIAGGSRAETMQTTSSGSTRGDDEKKRHRRSCLSEAKRVALIRLGFCGFHPERCTLNASRCRPRRQVMIVLVVSLLLLTIFLVLKATHDRSNDVSYLLPAANPNIHVLPD